MRFKVLSHNSIITALRSLPDDFYPKSILDPCMASGQALRALHEQYPNAAISGWERSNVYYNKAFEKEPSIGYYVVRDPAEYGQYDLVFNCPPKESWDHWAVSSLRMTNRNGYTILVLPANILLNPKRNRNVGRVWELIVTRKIDRIVTGVTCHEFPRVEYITLIVKNANPSTTIMETPFGEYPFNVNMTRWLVKIPDPITLSIFRKTTWRNYDTFDVLHRHNTSQHTDQWKVVVKTRSTDGSLTSYVDYGNDLPRKTGYIIADSEDHANEIQTILQSDRAQFIFRMSWWSEHHFRFILNRIPKKLLKIRLSKLEQDHIEKWSSKV